MGDRVLITFTDDGRRFTPAVYMHWRGCQAAEFIKDAAPLLPKGDSSYAVARFCGYCATKIEGAGGLGIIEGPTNTDFKSYSHGDAGVYVVNVETGEVQAHGGYGEPFQIDPSRFAA